MAHYIRRNLPQKSSGFRYIGYLVRNAKLIHELTRSLHSVPEGFTWRAEGDSADE